jgi:hypothetical protein
MAPVTLRLIKKHIKTCNKKGVKYNWLAYLETRDLTPEVEDLFVVTSSWGKRTRYYNWISGNEKLADIIMQLTQKETK